MSAEVLHSPRQPQQPLAFDLRLEREKALRYDESYYPTLLENAHRYADETFAQAPVVEYKQEIFDDGSLYFKEGDGYAPAAARVLEPSLNQNMPDWYRQRAQREYFAIKSLERHIATAQLGDRFLEFSPAPFDVPEKLLEGTAFGRHSFARLYEVVHDEETGSRRLLGKAHLNYLTPEAQAQLFQELTGSEIKQEELLGSIGALPPEIDMDRIREIVAAVPIEHTVEKPKNSPDQIRSQRIQEYVAGLDHYLEATFLLMLDPTVPESTIVNRFQDWEKLIGNFAKNGVDGSDFSAKDTRRMIEEEFYMTSRMQKIRDQEYEAWANSCGGGSGTSGAGSYEELTKTVAGSDEAGDRILCCTCPHCGKEVDAAISGGIITCPKCKATAKWKD